MHHTLFASQFTQVVRAAESIKCTWQKVNVHTRTGKTFYHSSNLLQGINEVLKKRKKKKRTNQYQNSKDKRHAQIVLVYGHVPYDNDAIRNANCSVVHEAKKGSRMS